MICVIDDAGAITWRGKCCSDPDPITAIVRGWSGPDFQETPNTPDLLAAEGIRYLCDWGNDEQPYRMTPANGPTLKKE